MNHVNFIIQTKTINEEIQCKRHTVNPLIYMALKASEIGSLGIHAH
jgi:hypothetical protein